MQCQIFMECFARLNLRNIEDQQRYWQMKFLLEGYVHSEYHLPADFHTGAALDVIWKSKRKLLLRSILNTISMHSILGKTIYFAERRNVTSYRSVNRLPKVLAIRRHSQFCARRRAAGTQLRTGRNLSLRVAAPWWSPISLTTAECPTI